MASSHRSHCRHHADSTENRCPFGAPVLVPRCGISWVHLQHFNSSQICQTGPDQRSTAKWHELLKHEIPQRTPSSFVELDLFSLESNFKCVWGELRKWFCQMRLFNASGKIHKEWQEHIFWRAGCHNLRREECVGPETKLCSIRGDSCIFQLLPWVTDICERPSDHWFCSP